MKKIFVIFSMIIIIVISWIGYKSYVGGTSPTIIGAINKQLQHVGSVDYIIRELPVNHGKIVFFLRKLNDGNFVVSMRYAKKTWGGWKTTYYGIDEGGSNIKYHLSEQVIKDMPISENYIPRIKNVNLNAMVQGVVIDPKITRVVIKDDKTGLERQAQILQINNDLKIYYTFIDNNQGKKFDIIAYNSGGFVIRKDTLDVNKHFSGSTTKHN